MRDIVDSSVAGSSVAGGESAATAAPIGAGWGAKASKASTPLASGDGGGEGGEVFAALGTLKKVIGALLGPFAWARSWPAISTLFKLCGALTWHS